MKSLNVLLSGMAIALLAGCAGTLGVPGEAREVVAMLAAHEHMAAAKPEEQRREFNAAQAAFEREATDVTRLNLALTLLLPRAPWRDDARVQSLLSGVGTAGDGQASPRRDFAQLLLRLVAERQRAHRDELRKAESLGQQLREERRRSEEMQQKIESLRSIDRDLRKSRRTP